MFCTGVLFQISTALVVWLGSASKGVTALGTIGTQITATNINLRPRYIDDDFCLNDVDRANSSGSVSSVNYCYAADIDLAIDPQPRPEVVYQATVGLYRSVGWGDDEEFQLKLVRDFVINITNVKLRERRTEFHCGTISIAPPIAVQADDVFGYCSRNLQSGMRWLVFNADTDNTSNILQCGNICQTGVVPDSIEDNALNTLDERLLLITANIEAENAQTVPPSFSEDTTTTTTQEDSNDSALAVERYIIIVVVFSLVAVTLFVLWLIVALVLAVKCRMDRKRREGSSSSGNNTGQNIPMNQIDVPAEDFPTVQYQTVSRGHISQQSTRSVRSNAALIPRASSQAISVNNMNMQLNQSYHSHRDLLLQANKDLQDNQRPPGQSNTVLQDTQRSPGRGNTVLQDTRRSPGCSNTTLQDNWRSQGRSNTSVLQDNRRYPGRSNTVLQDNLRSPRRSNTTVLQNNWRSPGHSNTSDLQDNHNTELPDYESVEGPRIEEQAVGESYDDIVVQSTEDSNYYY